MEEDHPMMAMVRTVSLSTVISRKDQRNPDRAEVGDRRATATAISSGYVTPSRLEGAELISGAFLIIVDDDNGSGG